MSLSLHLNCSLPPLMTSSVVVSCCEKSWSLKHAAYVVLILVSVICFFQVPVCCMPSFPVPARTSRVTLFKPLSGIVETEYNLATYERVVQVFYTALQFCRETQLCRGAATSQKLRVSILPPTLLPSHPSFFLPFLSTSIAPSLPSLPFIPVPPLLFLSQGSHP